MPSTRHFIVATAGHVDHGKSSLVQALTGVDTDRLPEEKSRGLTIDLGFAQLELPSHDGSEDMLAVGLIDVPGHADFVKNMVAGVGAVDLALLIVAADDGWMPQTEEHAQILQYLGVKEVLVVLTKIDRFEDLDLAIADIEEHLEGTPWEGAEIVEISAAKAIGIEQLKGAIGARLSSLETSKDINKPRLPIDRVFPIKGAGTVVTGTLSFGQISTSDHLVVQPAGIPIAIREIQAHHAKRKVAPPGSRVALNITGVSREDRDLIGRGSIICNDTSGEASNCVHAATRCVDRSDVIMRANRHIRAGRELFFHFGSGTMRTRIFLAPDSSLESASWLFVELRFYAPICCWVGDRFVLRDLSGRHTLAGGIVLDPSAPQRSLRKTEQVALLRARLGQPQSLEALMMSQIKRDRARRSEGFLAASPHAEYAISAGIEQLGRDGRILESCGWLLDSAWWREVSDLVLNPLHRFHQKQPERLGMPVTVFRKHLAEALPDKRLTDSILHILKQSELVFQGTVVRHKSHRPKLNPTLQLKEKRIIELLNKDPENPPSRSDSIKDADDARVLRFLFESGAAIELNEKTLISRQGFEALRQQVVATIRENGPATTGELRQKIPTSRRIFVPFLEKLDADGVTVRTEDRRSLSENWL